MNEPPPSDSQRRIDKHSTELESTSLGLDADLEKQGLDDRSEGEGSATVTPAANEPVEVEKLSQTTRPRPSAAPSTLAPDDPLSELIPFRLLRWTEKLISRGFERSSKLDNFEKDARQLYPLRLGTLPHVRIDSLRRLTRCD